MNDLVFFENQINMGAGTTLSVRSTLIKLQNKAHILISPINFSDSQLIDVIRQKPNVIVAPNCFHHLFVKKAADELQITSLYAAKGLQKKRSDIKWTAEIDSKNWPFSHELEIVLIEGAPRFNEVVFYHVASKTLIVTDLIFNFKNLAKNYKTFIYQLMGTFNKPACSRLLKLLTRDKKAMQASLQKILNLDFDRIVMAHGEIINENAKEILKSALVERGLI